MAIDPSVMSGFQSADVGGSIAKGDELMAQRAQNQLSAKSDAATMSDTQVLQDALKSGEVDLHTFEGTQKALPLLQTKLSPDAYMKIANHADTLRTHETNYAKSLQTLNADQRKIAHDTSGEIADALSPFVQKDTTPDDVSTRWPEVRATLAKMTLPDGKTPMYPDTVLQQWDAKSPEMKMGEARASKKRSEIAKTVYEETRADALRTGGAAGAKVTALAAVDDDLEAGLITPAQATERKQTISSGGGRSGGSSVNDVNNQVTEILKNPNPALVDAAVLHAVTGEKPTLGGVRNPNAIAEGLLYSKIRNDPVALGVANRYNADKKSLANIVRQSDVTSTTADAVKQLMEDVKPLLKNTQDPSGTGIRKLNEMLLSIQKNVTGNEDTLVTQQFITDITTDIAKVVSGATGVAASPVAFLKKGEIYLPEGLGDYTKIYDGLVKSMESRTKAYAKKRQDIEKQGQRDLELINRRVKSMGLKTSAESEGAEPTVPDSGVTGSPSDSTTLPVDDARIELRKARQMFQSTTDPKQKELSGKVVADLEAKIKGVEATPAVPVVDPAAKAAAYKQYGLKHGD